MMASELEKTLLEAAYNAVREVCPEPLRYRRRTAGLYDESTGRAIPGFVESDVYALVAHSPEMAAPGASVPSSSVSVSAPASQFGFEPAVGDEVAFGGAVWAVSSVRPKVRLSAVIMWELGVARG